MLFNSTRHVRTFLTNLQASKRNLVYPNYAWIFYALYPDKWWTDNTIPVDCSNEELERFLFNSGGILAHIVPEPDNFDSLTSAGIVSSVFACLPCMIFSVFVCLARFLVCVYVCLAWFLFVCTVLPGFCLCVLPCLVFCQ